VRRTAAALLLTVCATGRAQDAPPTCAPPVREIRVRVACDEEFRRRADWRENACTRVMRASSGWEEQFGVRWVPVECVEWKSDDGAAALQDLRVRLAAEVAPGDADVVLGIVGQDRAKGAVRAYHALGNTQYFDRVAMVGADWPGRPPNEVSAIAHEFGHLLGAWHAAKRGTVMTAPSASTLCFDDEARELIPLVRDFDFKKGLDQLDDAKVAAFDRLYRRSHAVDADHPIAYALTVRAYRRVSERKYDLAVADFERSIAINEAAEGKDARGLVPCLVGLSKLCFVRKPADPARELSLARRAREIADKCALVEDPIADSWIQLGHALWTNGDDEGAIAAYRTALLQCRDALGTTHPRTLEQRGNVEWFAGRGFASAKKALAEADAKPPEKR
jgi:tetratricopeptide (TPR) repeat protein